MGDDLWIAGGGRIAVATSELFAFAELLDRSGRELSGVASLLDRADRRTSRHGLTAAAAAAGWAASADRTERAIDDALRLVHAAAVESRGIAIALRVGADGYGVVEASVSAAAQAAAARVAASVGFLVGTLGLLALPGLMMSVGAGAALYGGAAYLAPDETAGARAAVEEGLLAQRHLLSDPAVVALIRLAVMSSDDAGLGLARVPPVVVGLAGDEGAGLVGLTSSAAALVVAGRLAGGLRETPVTVRQTRWATGGPPAVGLEDRAARVPSGAAQVRIDRYSVAGKKDRFEVYIGGTADFSLRATDEPFDMTSNVGGMAGVDSGAYRAVLSAMQDAGIEEGSEIAVTGYSQGGLVAAMLAGSGRYDVRGLYTLGAPVGQVPVPKTIPWIALEHTDDLVPAVGGTWATDDAVLVRREVSAAGAGESELAVPAHGLDHYRETAALADASGESRVAGVGAGLDALSRDAESVESTWYRARRTPGG